MVSFYEYWEGNLEEFYLFYFYLLFTFKGRKQSKKRRCIRHPKDKQLISTMSYYQCSDPDPGLLHETMKRILYGSG